MVYHICIIYVSCGIPITHTHIYSVKIIRKTFKTFGDICK